MAEKSAAELLYAQLDAEVAEAKNALAGRFSGELVEKLCEVVTKRWWIKRMTDVKKPEPNPEESQQRMMQRMNVLGNIVDGIVRNSGNIEPNSLQVQYMALSAEITALWGLMIELGLATEDMRHEYTDNAIAGMYNRAMEAFKTPRIAIPNPRGRLS